MTVATACLQVSLENFDYFVVCFNRASSDKPVILIGLLMFLNEIVAATSLRHCARSRPTLAHHIGVSTADFIERICSLEGLNKLHNNTIVQPASDVIASSCAC